MSREWQPGDVAMATYRLGQCVETNLCAKTDKGWDCLTPGVGFLMHGDVIAARPLVVIDPEDRAQVERLAKTWWANIGTSTHVGAQDDALQAALREFADPKPAKPEEPLGLGAVVEDADGRKWIRCNRPESDPTNDDWQRAGYVPDDGRRWFFYNTIDAVKVLSEGVIS